MKSMSDKKWIAVDLDGTLAHYESGQGVAYVGQPIEPMIKRVKTWLAEGKIVKIFTARVCGVFGEEDRQQQVAMIQAWCLCHLGQSLEVTAVKDIYMVELWDDRAVGVLKNTGRTVSPSLLYYDRDYGIESDIQSQVNTTWIDIIDIIDFKHVTHVTSREARCLAAQLLRAADELDPR